MPGPAVRLPAPDDGPASGIYITGGSRGLTVEYRELEAAGNRLGSDEVPRLMKLEVSGVSIYLQLYGASASPETASRAADTLTAAVRTLGRTIDELEDTARGLRKAAANYLEMEERAGCWPDPGSRLGLGLYLWQRQGWGLPERTLTDLLMPPFDRVLLQAALGTLAAGQYGKLRPVDVTRIDAGSGTVSLAGTSSALLDRSQKLHDSEDQGVVEILSVDRGGARTWIVTLPGTQDTGSLFVGTNPFDSYGIAEARTEDSQYVAAAVAEALRQAGASAEDAVILVGYSQGGIHAVNTGARLAESGEFSVKMIVTAGAPDGDRLTPAGVKVLHFEHTQDWVPGADGSSNPDTPDRITVTGTTPVPEPAESAALGPAHQLPVYRDLAKRADTSADPSLQDSLGYLAGIIPPNSIATRGLFRFSRKKPVKAAKKPVAPASSKPGPVKVPGLLQSNVPVPGLWPGLKPPVPRPFNELPGGLEQPGADRPQLPARSG